MLKCVKIKISYFVYIKSNNIKKNNNTKKLIICMEIFNIFINLSP